MTEVFVCRNPADKALLLHAIPSIFSGATYNGYYASCFRHG